MTSSVLRAFQHSVPRIGDKDHPLNIPENKRKASPGYRDGEQEAIAAYLAKHKPTICPGFGSGESVEWAKDKVEQKLARAQKNPGKRSFAQETAARELRARIVALWPLYKDQSDAKTKIARLLGCSRGTVVVHLDKARIEHRPVKP